MESGPGTRGALRGDAALLRAFGVAGLVAAVLNVIIGGGVFRLPAALAASIGEAAPLAFLAGAIAIVPVALCFAAAGSRVAATGGPYSYAAAAFGPLPGFLVGALMWVCNLAASAAIAAALVDQFAAAWPAAVGGAARSAAIVLLYAGLIALNAFGVRLGARAIVVLASIKLTPLIVLAAAGFMLADFSALAAMPWPSLAALGSSMVLVMFAYSGMETALIPSGEVNDPGRAVPRATLAAIAIVVLVYIGVQLAAQALVGTELPGHRAPLAASAGALWAPGFGLLLAVAAVSMLGFLQGNLLGSSRVAYALGRDGFLPSALGDITPRHRVPLVAVATHGTIACALALAGNFPVLALISGGANCLVYVAVALAAGALQRRGHAEQGEPFAMGGGWTIPILACAAMGLILATLTRAEWLAIIGATGVLVALYPLLAWSRRRRA